ncbi:MAG TPA: type 2 lanthipeptide synthetase LanM family protein [Polyangiaceae bacterium]|nr:type 2 lanthipeptide synthetase LanM family protein [Polyangiaceae bacterium]
MVLELNVARLEERLQGETPEARCRYYVETLLEQPAEWERLFDEYHGLARILCTTLQRWVNAVCEVLEHLSADFPRLATDLLRSEHRLRLVELTGGLSDPHRGGRGVWKLVFAPARAVSEEKTSEPLRVVYKPRPLAVEVHFQALLAFCNDGARRGALHFEHVRHAARPRGGDDFPMFRRLRVLDCGEHGWVEHVDRRDCRDAAEVERFYLRQGAYLALLHVVDGVDMHDENLIACGEDPVLVDLETLFHAPLPGRPVVEGARGLAMERINDSVIRTTFLPGRTWGADGGGGGINVGGLGDGEPQVVPLVAGGWEGTGTDVMHAAEKNYERPVGDNVPRVDGIVASVADYAEALVAGFEATLRFLGTEREALLAVGGPIAAFARDEVRYILRGTALYGKLLVAGRHPDRMRDLLEREQAFDLLWRVSTKFPALWRVVPTEKEDLRLGDIPYFTARPDDCHLRGSRGELLRDFFPTPPMESVLARLRAQGEGEIADEVFIIRAALSAAFATEERPNDANRGAVQWSGPAQEPMSPSAAAVPSMAAHSIDMASAIGEQLVRTAILGPRDVAWLGMASSEDGMSFHLAPMDVYLYEGTAGVALFLAYLGRLAREDGFTRLAERAAQGVRDGLKAAVGDPSNKVSGFGGSGGGFTGVPSALYALAHLAVMWDEPSVLPPLHPLLERLAASLPDDDKFDVIHGAAGRLLVLLSLYETTGDESALVMAAECGHHLARHAVRDAASNTTTAVWKSSVGGRALAGMSHGCAGIAFALSRLAHAITSHDVLGRDAPDFLRLADEALAFERACFDASEGNWPDFRHDPYGPVPDGTEKPRFRRSWCNGAPGIALARLMTPTFDRDPLARREVEIAIETTLAGPLHPGHTLCHGEFGNLMIVGRAAAALNRADWQHLRDERWAAALARLSAWGPSCGFDFPQAVPSLMNGTAGIGYGLLHLARPDEVPPLLALVPPRRAGAGS